MANKDTKEKETKVETKEEAKKETKEEAKEETNVSSEDEKDEDIAEEEVENSNEDDPDDSDKEDKDSRDQKIDELNDRLLRNQAEFENFRKRSEKEKAAMFDMGASTVLEKMLPVVDNFERGLDTADDSPFAEGMKMIYKQLMTSFEELGVTPIVALGETFDPELHNAVMHEDNEEAGESEVTQELQKGYKYKDHVLRHSMVKVAN